jgi:GT2 family glycosyltransferase
MKPLVSILIPAYNAAEWIAATLDSACSQAWARKEIIVVDDESSDNTAALAMNFASKNVKVVTQENQGAAAARNRALSLSQGDFIQWLDADDVLAPDKVAKQMEVMERHGDAGTLLSSAWGSFSYRLDKAEFHPSPLWNDLSPLEWLTRKMEGNDHMQTATWLVSREMTEAAGPWDTRLLSDDDGEYFCRVLLASEQVRFVPESKVFYRRTDTGRLSYIGFSDEKKEAMLLSMKLHIGYLRSLEDSDRVRAACLTYLHTWLIHIYPERPDLVAELDTLASELEGQLEMPKLRWKYAWMKPLIGFGPAKRAQFVLPQFKSSLQRRWEKLQHQLAEGRPN